MSRGVEIQFGALRIFAVVAESKTLTDAATRLGITQSAVSQAVAQFEEITATSLLVRRSRPIKLTPSGQTLNVHAKKILADTRQMLAAVQQDSNAGLSNFNIGFIDSFGDAVGPQIVDKLDFAAARISLHTGFNSPLSEAFIQRDLDLLITSDPMLEHPELERHAILKDPFLMLVPDRFVTSETPLVQRLAAEVPFVRYTRLSRIGALTDLVTRRLNVSPSTRYEFDSTQTLMRFVQAGQGWAIATGLCIAQFPALLEGVHVLPLGGGDNARHISLVARPDELGTLPEKVASLCREIYVDDVLPRTVDLTPWLKYYAGTRVDVPLN